MARPYWPALILTAEGMAVPVRKPTFARNKVRITPSRNQRQGGCKGAKGRSSFRLGSRG